MNSTLERQPGESRQHHRHRNQQIGRPAKGNPSVMSFHRPGPDGKPVYDTMPVGMLTSSVGAQRADYERRMDRLRDGMPSTADFGFESRSLGQIMALKGKL